MLDTIERLGTQKTRRSIEWGWDGGEMVTEQKRYFHCNIYELC